MVCRDIAALNAGSGLQTPLNHDSLSDLEAFDRSNTSDEGEKDSRLADADYYCNECSMDLYNSESLQEHYESKHANTIYGWKSFGISEISLFDSTTDEEDHILPAAPDAKNDDIRKSRQACCGCPMVFYTDAELRRHAETVHAPKAMQTDEERPFQCDICYHVYTTPKGVYEHQLVKRQLRYLCATCGLLYGKLQALTRHEFCHKDETHACDACGKNFLNPFALRKHKRTVHGCSEFAASKSHICKVCGTSVSSAGYLKLHMKLHSKTGAYVCELCGERFKLNRYLQGHRAERHTGQHRCNECQISFKTAAALKNHLYRHGGTKQFSCGICGASFYTANNRPLHPVAGVGPPPFAKRVIFRVVVRPFVAAGGGEWRTGVVVIAVSSHSTVIGVTGGNCISS
uniref:C2H2-type domain-containing protein n=1 Tax=Anopheles dirus TaxID=7168 RepID=A0A182NTJ9_9DIPT